MTVEWHGYKILAEAESVVGKREKDTAEEIEAEAKRLCPVSDPADNRSWGSKGWQSRESGRLRRAIKAKPSKYKDGGWIVYVPAQGSDTYYSRWVELGAPKRKNFKRKPFLRPALERKKKDFYWGVKKDLLRKWAG